MREREKERKIVQGRKIGGGIQDRTNQKCFNESFYQHLGRDWPAMTRDVGPTNQVWGEGGKRRSP